MRGAAMVMLALAVGCGGMAPELPPVDTMTLDFEGLSDDGALVDPTKKTHWGQAVVRVGLLNAWVGVALSRPVATFRLALSQRPDFADGTWTWRYPVKTADVDATATLTATPGDAGTHWQMRVDGKVGAQQFTDFLWFEGHSHEATSGDWQFYDQDGRLLRIDWQREDALDRQLLFTNNSGRDGDGHLIEYRVLDASAFVAYDLGAPKKAEITWNRVTREGSILADDFQGHEGEKACWNVDLFDAHCPEE